MSSKTTNRLEVPEAKEALDRFKMEVADELGVPLSHGYNGNPPLLTRTVASAAIWSRK